MTKFSASLSNLSRRRMILENDALNVVIYFLTRFLATLTCLCISPALEATLRWYYCLAKEVPSSVLDMRGLEMRRSPALRAAVTST